MKLKVLLIFTVCLCLVGCGSISHNGVADSQEVSEDELEKVGKEEDKEELKELTYASIVDIATSTSFDWDTLATTYKVDNIEIEGISYYVASIKHNDALFKLFAQVGIAGGDGTSVFKAYLQNVSTMKILELYTSGMDDRCTVEQIDEFVERQESLSQYLTVDIPNGYKLGTYRAGLEGMFTGCLLYTDSEKEQISLSYKERHGGVFVCETGDEILKYEGEVLSYIKGSAISNVFEFVQDSENIVTIEGCQIISGVGTMEDAEFWYVFIDRDSDECCYMLYFNKEDFTREQAKDIINSIEFSD